MFIKRYWHCNYQTAQWLPEWKKDFCLIWKNSLAQITSHEKWKAGPPTNISQGLLSFHQHCHHAAVTHMAPCSMSSGTDRTSSRAWWGSAQSILSHCALLSLIYNTLFEACWKPLATAIPIGASHSLFSYRQCMNTRSFDCCTYLEMTQ